MHSVAKDTAVSKPKVTTVFDRSLSIVFGTPTMRTPFLASAFAIVSEPSPPTATTASIAGRGQALHQVVRSGRPRSRCRRCCRTGYLSGLPALVVPMIVPPRWVIPRTRSGVSGISPPSPGTGRAGRSRCSRRGCRRPPSRGCARQSATARITALSPGASPPPGADADAPDPAASGGLLARHSSSRSALSIAG